MNLTVEDLKYFQQQHPDYRLELVDGAIIVMSPSGLRLWPNCETEFDLADWGVSLPSAESVMVSLPLPAINASQSLHKDALFIQGFRLSEPSQSLH